MENDQVAITIEEGTMTYDVRPPTPTNFFGSIISGVKEMILVNGPHSSKTEKEETLSCEGHEELTGHDQEYFLDNPQTAVDFINSLGIYSTFFLPFDHS